MSHTLCPAHSFVWKPPGRQIEVRALEALSIVELYIVGLRGRENASTGCSLTLPELCQQSKLPEFAHVVATDHHNCRCHACLSNIRTVITYWCALCQRILHDYRGSMHCISKENHTMKPPYNDSLSPSPVHAFSGCSSSTTSSVSSRTSCHAQWQRKCAQDICDFYFNTLAFPMATVSPHESVKALTGIYTY